MSTEAQPRIFSDENRDLGFGSIVAQESQIRLLNRDGSFNVTRKGLSFWTSLSFYHALLTMAWWKFIGLIVLAYSAANAAFAMVYVMCGPGALQSSANEILGSGFLRAFFFSVHTLSTIGYGNVVPSSLAANIVVAFESLLGLLGFALATGIIFSRFSRPIAKILFSRVAVVAPYRGITAFEFRVTNARSSQIIELEAKVVFSRFEQVEGTAVRKFYPLSLEREKVAFFPLSWTVVHPIDESSPLKDLSRQDLLETHAEFLVLLTGIDETFSQTVHSRSSYRAEEIVRNARFVNIFNRIDPQQPLTVNLERFHGIEQLG